jgi:hypothetical protein
MYQPSEPQLHHNVTTPDSIIILNTVSDTIDLPSLHNLIQSRLTACASNPSVQPLSNVIPPHRLRVLPVSTV